jgi:hypothetical protein
MSPAGPPPNRLSISVFSSFFFSMLLSVTFDDDLLRTIGQTLGKVLDCNGSDAVASCEQASCERRDRVPPFQGSDGKDEVRLPEACADHRGKSDSHRRSQCVWVATSYCLSVYPILFHRNHPVAHVSQPSTVQARGHGLPGRAVRTSEAKHTAEPGRARSSPIQLTSHGNWLVRSFRICRRPS